MVGGVASTLTATTAAQVSDEKKCEERPLADALMLFMELLFDVQQSAIVKAAEATFKPARDCEKTLCQLSERIDALKAEICESSKSKRAQQMRDLVETGRVNAQLLEKSSGASPAKFASLAVSLNTINSLIDDAARDVEIECKIILTEKGKRLLLEIIKLIDLNRWICTRITESQQVFASDVDLARCRVRAVQHYIFEAADAITHNNLPKLDENIDNAVRTLRLLDSSVADQPVNTNAPVEPSNLKPAKEVDSIDHSDTPSVVKPAVAVDCMPEKPSPLPPGNPTEVLIGMLRGTQELAKNPAARPQVTWNHDSGRDERRVLVKSVAAHSRRAMLAENIGTLLDTYCKPYTYYRRAVLSVGVDVAWTTYRNNPGKRAGVIWWTLSKIGCPAGSDPTTLVSKLA